MVVVFFIAKETSVVSFYCTCCFHWIIFEPEQVVGIGLRHDRDVDKTPKEMMMWLKREKKDDFTISLFFMNFLLLSVEKNLSTGVNKYGSIFNFIHQIRSENDIFFNDINRDLRCF